jgi:hypothetical protein
MSNIYKGCSDDEARTIVRQRNDSVAAAAERHKQLPDSWKTAEDWWKAADLFKSEMLYIIQRFLPARYSDAEQAYQARDAKTLANILNKTWIAAPDSGWIHAISGWGVFCDLCSECPLVMGPEDVEE